jgi:hypothetical protein
MEHRREQKAMKRWECRITIEHAGDIKTLVIYKWAITKEDAEDIAYEYFNDYADKAVAEQPCTDIDPPILQGIKTIEG